MMFLSNSDWMALGVSFQLAFYSVFFLLLFAVPFAWFLARSSKKWVFFLEAFFTLPLLLPPTVLGFYLLIVLSPQGILGTFFQSLGLPAPAFRMEGLVFGSVLYSFPFVLTPLKNAFEKIPQAMLEAAATLGANSWSRFFSVVLPESKSAFLSAAILGFAHTLGEFGVVLMIGGSIPGKTKVASIAIFEHVESLAYQAAHNLSVVLVCLALFLVILLYALQKKEKPT